MTAIREKVILVDCDGVLMDWYYAFDQFMTTEKGHKRVSEVPDMTLHSTYDCTVEALYGYIQQFNWSTSVGKLPPYKNAIYYIDLLHRKHGYIFHMITSMVRDDWNDEDNNELARQARMKNTRRLFGETAFDKYLFTTDGDKMPFLAQYRDTGCFFIDDHPEHVKAANEVGLEGLLMYHDYNANAGAEGHLTMFSDWQYIYRYITNEG